MSAKLQSLKIIFLAEEPEDEDAFDVKNLMNKFKNIENLPSKAPIRERPLDLEGVKVIQLCKKLTALHKIVPCSNGFLLEGRLKLSVLRVL